MNPPASRFWPRGGQNAWLWSSPPGIRPTQLGDNLRSIGSDHELLIGGMRPKTRDFGDPRFPLSAWAEWNPPGIEVLAVRGPKRLVWSSPPGIRPAYSLETISAVSGKRS